MNGNSDKQRASYCESIRAAHARFKTEDFRAARQLLDDCPAEFRGWEWHYLDTKVGSSVEMRGSITSRVNYLALDRDGRLLASAHEDGSIKIWHIPSGEQVHSLAGHGDEVHQVAFHPDGKRLASASSDQTVRVWDVEKGRQILKIPDGFFAVAYREDGRQIAATNFWGNLVFYDAQSGQVQESREWHHYQRDYFGADAPDTLGNWYEETPVNEERAVPYGSDWATIVIEGSNGVSAHIDGQSGSATIWRRGQSDGELTELYEFDYVQALAFSSDGSRMAVRSSGLHILDVSRRSAERELIGEYADVRTFAFSSDGKRIAPVSSGPGMLDADSFSVWEVVDGRKILSMDGHDTDEKITASEREPGA